MWALTQLVSMANMETDGEGGGGGEEELPGRWRDLQKLLTRGSPLAHPDFEPSDQVCIGAVQCAVCVLMCVCVCVCVCVDSGFCEGAVQDPGGGSRRTWL